MKRPFSHFHPLRFACVMLAVGILLLFCGFTALAAETPGTRPSSTAPLPPYPEDMTELYPTDVQTVIGDGTRQIADRGKRLSSQFHKGSRAEIRRGWL